MLSVLGDLFPHQIREITLHQPLQNGWSLPRQGLLHLGVAQRRHVIQACQNSVQLGVAHGFALQRIKQCRSKVLQLPGGTPALFAVIEVGRQTGGLGQGQASRRILGNKSKSG